MKRVAIVLLSIIVLLTGLVSFVRYSSRPPKEATLLKTFYSHRTSFEQLRDMLRQDTAIQRLADWGVHTDDGISKPPAGNFPLDRFEKYLALLKEAHAYGVSRSDGPDPELNILVWGRGFAGNTDHIGICWRETAPARQVSSFDVCYRDGGNVPAGSGWVFRHIDGNWYLWTDLWSED